MTVALVTPPALEPITLAQAKRHLRIEEPDEDVHLADLLAACRAHVEEASGRKLITQVWRRYAMPRRNAPIPLLVGPVQRVDAVTLYDADGVASALDPPHWRLGNEALLLDGLHARRAANGVEVDVVCGYGDTADDVPATLRQAILLLLAQSYEFRGAVGPDDQPISVPPNFERLIAPHRRRSL